MLNLKDDDFYNELKKFNVIENLDGKKIFDSKIKNMVGIKKSSIINEEFINKLKDTLLSNIIVIKSNKLIENNKLIIIIIFKINFILHFIFLII